MFRPKKTPVYLTGPGTKEPAQTLTVVLAFLKIAEFDTLYIHILGVGDGHIFCPLRTPDVLCLGGWMGEDLPRKGRGREGKGRQERSNGGHTGRGRSGRRVSTAGVASSIHRKVNTPKVKINFVP